MSQLVSNPILNTIAAAHADLTIVGRVFNVANVDTAGNKFIPMDFSKINIIPRPVILRSLVEVLAKQTFTFVAANDTAYGFTIQQMQPDGTVLPTRIQVKSATTGATAATIATQINAYIAGKARGQLKVTSSGAGTVITVVALTGYPVFTMTGALNGTIATAAANIITYASSTDATPSVVTSAAHGLSTGTRVTLGGTPDAGSPMAVATAAGGLWRITVINANTFSVDGTVATGTPDATGGTVTLYPQAPRGYPTGMAAAGILGTSASGTYAQCTYWFGQQEVKTLDMQRDRQVAQTLWVNELATNFAAFLTYWAEANNAYNAGAVTTDPETVAVT